MSNNSSSIPYRKPIEKKCLRCSNIHYVYSSDIKRGKGKFCSRNCAVQALFKPMTELMCSGCGITFKRLRYKVDKKIAKHYCSHKCFLKNSIDFKDATRGPKNRLWKGGKCKPWRNRNPKYMKWRKTILESQGNKCNYCKSVDKLEVDHLWPYKYWPNLAFHPKNGQILCHECHKKTFTYGHRNSQFLQEVRKELGDKVINFPPPEVILQAKRQILEEEKYESLQQS